MKDLCRGCAKIFCENRNNSDCCDNRISFSEANIIDKPTYIENNNDNKRKEN